MALSNKHFLPQHTGHASFICFGVRTLGEDIRCQDCTCNRRRRLARLEVMSELLFFVFPYAVGVWCAVRRASTVAEGIPWQLCSQGPSASRVVPDHFLVMADKELVVPGNVASSRAMLPASMYLPASLASRRCCTLRMLNTMRSAVA